MNIYNFRIDRKEREELLTRLQEKIISMGWGGAQDNLSMLDHSNSFEKYKKVYGISSRRFNSIMKIKTFKDDDIIVIPNLPEDGKFIIAVVDGNFPDCYLYKENDSTHLNHCIKAKKIYGLEGSLDIHNVKVHDWYAKLGWMRLPIYPLFRYKEIFIDLIDSLQNNPESVLSYSQLGEYIDQIKNEIRKSIKKKLQNIAPSGSSISFENICREIIISYGYKLIRGNHHDGNGGDTDCIFAPQDETNDPFTLKSDNLYVQIKKHQDESGKEAVDQLIKIMEADDKEKSAQGCAITLGKFNEEAEKLADKHDIILINGDELVDMFIDSLL